MTNMSVFWDCDRENAGGPNLERDQLDLISVSRPSRLSCLPSSSAFFRSSLWLFIISAILTRPFVVCRRAHTSVCTNRIIRSQPPVSQSRAMSSFVADTSLSTDPGDNQLVIRQVTPDIVTFSVPFVSISSTKHHVDTDSSSLVAIRSSSRWQRDRCTSAEQRDSCLRLFTTYCRDQRHHCKYGWESQVVGGSRRRALFVHERILRGLSKRQVSILSLPTYAYTCNTTTATDHGGQDYRSGTIQRLYAGYRMDGIVWCRRRNATLRL